MKNFFQFLNEATESQASAQAKKLNLKSDGHGGWLDTRGKFVAKTEDGKLKFLSKREAKQEEQGQKRTARPQPTAAAKPKAKEEDKTETKAKGSEEGGEESGEISDTLTLAFGRFNPPTVGHGKLLAAAKKAAAGGDLKIYPSRTQDAKKNPLDPDMKVSYMKKMFPEYEENIVNDDEMKSIFNVLVTASEQGYGNVNIIVGSDRQSEFENLAQKYNGELYDFNLIRVISAGVRDADAEGVEGMSASKMRKAAAEGDFDTFQQGIPKSVSKQGKEELFMTLRTSMQVEEFDEFAEASFNLHEIAPKLDPQGLRDSYITGDLYQVGCFVENVNTGIIGKVVSRGSNYVIYVDEQDNIFRSWLKDLTEKSILDFGFDYTPAGEVGTKQLNDYMRKLTPGEFIRKINKKDKVTK